MHAAIMDSFPILSKSFYHYDDKMSIHSVIRSNRIRLKLTEQQLAERCGVSRPAVQQWEKEGGTAPKRAIQPLVVEVLGISLAQLHETGADKDGIPHAPAGISEAIEQLALFLMPLDDATRGTIASLLADMARHPERVAQIAVAVKSISAFQAPPARSTTTVQTLKDLNQLGNPLVHTIKPSAYKKGAK